MKNRTKNNSLIDMISTLKVVMNVKLHDIALKPPPEVLAELPSDGEIGRGYETPTTTQPKKSIARA
jgi:hypothetical protein